MKSNIFIFILICLQILFGHSKLSNNYKAEKYCTIDKINYLRDFEGKEIFYGQFIGLKCEIKNSGFTLDVESFDKIKKKIKDHQLNDLSFNVVELNWLSKSSSLTSQLNLTAFMRLFLNFNLGAWIFLHNLNSIELELFNESYYSSTAIYLFNSDLRFVIDGRTAKTCADINSARNGSLKISSLFQIPLRVQQNIFLFGCRFPLTICPLIFNRAYIDFFYIFHQANTFYKTNLIRFANQTFDNLNSTILQLYLYHSVNLDLDTSFLNPSVFRNLQHIFVSCSLNSISVDLFSSLKSFTRITFFLHNFRKLIHHNGIGWIKGINRDLHVNLSNLTDFVYNSKTNKYIYLATSVGYQLEPVLEIFPEEDFCIYKDYPFDQMVFTQQFCDTCYRNDSIEFLAIPSLSYGCTYLWINQYYHLFMFIPNIDRFLMSNLFFFLTANSYKNRNNCNFERRLALCNRSDYHLKDIWDTTDYFIFNKKIQIIVKILTYLVSLFSVTTNILVIRIILAKHNKHVFKDFKHYTYLGLISVFSLSISFIEIFSWFSECFYPFEVFCLGVHKTVIAQLFKMVVKECIIITFRFMSNFCYIAFAINRIALIDRDPNKFVKVMSALTIWKYVLFSLIISLAFSWIKYFKYTINFGLGELNYPIWNERDIATPWVYLPSILDFYMVFNVISDLLNYLVFVIVCFVVDLIMLVRLRSTVNESIERINKMGSNEKQMEKKKSELEETMKKSIQMVVLNTTIGLFFKLPLVFLPLVNTIAKFYYKNTDERYSNLAFDKFYTQFFDGEFYPLIQDSTELLYLISVSIQYFIYKRFDKKFKEATLSSPSLEVKHLGKYT